MSLYGPHVYPLWKRLVFLAACVLVAALGADELIRAATQGVIRGGHRFSYYEVQKATDPLGFWFAAMVWGLITLISGSLSGVVVVVVIHSFIPGSSRLSPAAERRLSEPPEPHRATLDPTA
jgi:hypothetical protein